MRPIATDGVLRSVCVFVCPLVTFVNPAKTVEPRRDAAWKVASGGPNDGEEMPTGRGSFWGFPVIEKYWESLLRCTQQKGSFSSLNNSTTSGDVAFRQNV